MKPVRLVFAALLIVMAWQACRHHPLPIPVEPGDTSTNPIDTTGPIDTTQTPDPIDTSGQACVPGTVYFVNDIMPLLTKCTMPDQSPGCHVSGHDDGVVFTGATNQQVYNNVFTNGDIDPGDPNGSDFYEVLVDNDPDKHMPPPGFPQLTQQEIQMVEQWIQAGAPFNECNENYGQPLACDTVDNTYTNTIAAIMTKNCTGCHNSTVAMAGFNLTNYQGVKNAQNDNGRLKGSVNHLGDFTPMPYNKPKLSDCTVQKINAWINAGMPE